MNGPEPWRANDVVRLVLGQLACIAAVVAAARSTGNRTAVDDQILWLNLAVVAAVGSGLFNGLWLLRLRRATGERRQAVLGGLEAVADGPAPARDGDDAPGLVAVGGLSLVHRPDCALIAGRPLVVPAADGERCGWCQR